MFDAGRLSERGVGAELHAHAPELTRPSLAVLATCADRPQETQNIVPKDQLQLNETELDEDITRYANGARLARVRVGQGEGGGVLGSLRACAGRCGD